MSSFFFPDSNGRAPLRHVLYTALIRTETQTAREEQSVYLQWS